MLIRIVVSIISLSFGLSAWAMGSVAFQSAIKNCSWSEEFQKEQLSKVLDAGEKCKTSAEFSAYLKQNPWKASAQHKVDAYAAMLKQPGRDLRIHYYLAKCVPEIWQYIGRDSEIFGKFEFLSSSDLRSDKKSVLDEPFKEDDAQFVASFDRHAHHLLEKGIYERRYRGEQLDALREFALSSNMPRILLWAFQSDTKSPSCVLKEYMETRDDVTLQQATTYLKALKVYKEQQVALGRAHQKILSSEDRNKSMLAPDMQRNIKQFLYASQNPSSSNVMDPKMRKAIEQDNALEVERLVNLGYSLTACCYNASTQMNLDALELAVALGKREVLLSLSFFLPYINEEKQQKLHKLAQGKMIAVIEKELPEHVERLNKMLLICFEERNMRPGSIFRALNQGANPNIQDERGNTVLHKAIQQKQLGLAKILLELYGADPNIKNNNNKTPLHLAFRKNSDDASSDCHEAVEMLLANGAQVNIRDHDGQTPLHNAAFHSLPETLELLLDHEADPNAQDQFGIMPLYIVLQHYPDIEIIRLLLERGANTNHIHPIWNNPLHLVIHKAINSAYKPSINILETFIKYGAEIDAQDKECDTALHCLGSTLLDTSFASKLLELGANPNIKNRNGQTSLHLAARFGNQKLVELLLKHGANPNMQDNDGKTALHYAIKGNAEGLVGSDKIRDLINVLLENKADHNIRDCNGYTPLVFAQERLDTNKVAVKNILALLNPCGVKKSLKTQTPQWAKNIGIGLGVLAVSAIAIKIAQYFKGGGAQ